MASTSIDYQYFISERSKARKPSAIRALSKYLHQKDMISLGAGAPNPDTFPFAGMSVTLKTGETIEIDNNLFSRSLSYDLTSGLPQLNNWLRELQDIEHKPQVEYDLTIGSGSQDLLTKAFEMMLNDGDSILVERPTYTGILSFLRTIKCDLADVETDGEGIIPEELEAMLKDWPNTNPSGKKNQPRPRCLYTIACGGNPTGATATLERKKEIYRICSEYNILILEDDAYYYLQFAKEKGGINSGRIPSYLSMDVDGRVLRCDSMSKILSAGLRIGWMTGPKPLIERINIHSMVTNLQPSGVPQVIAYQLLDHWKHDGFFKHVDQVADFYRTKRDEFVECLDRRMKGRAEWVVPTAGMFIWLKLLGGIKDSYTLVMEKALKENVLAVPGVAFLPNEEITEYIRVSYSNVSKEDMDEALRRLALVVDQEAASNSST